jgi:hypothetical protein
MDTRDRAVHPSRVAPRLTWVVAAILLAVTGCSGGESMHGRPDSPSILSDWWSRSHAAPGSFWLPRSEIVAGRCGTSSASGAVAARENPNQADNFYPATGVRGSRVTCDGTTQQAAATSVGRKSSAN